MPGQPSPPPGPPPQRAPGGLRTMLAGTRAHPGPAAVAAFFGCLNGATMVVGAVVVGHATDLVVLPGLAGEPVPASSWLLSALAILAVSALRWSSIVFRGIATGHVQFAAAAETRRAVLHRYLDLALEWHRGRPPGRLLAHAISDVDAVWAPMQWFYFALGTVGMLLFAMVELWRRDVALGLIGLAVVLAILATNLAYQRLLRGRTREVQAARARVVTLAQESVDGGEVVRSLGLAAAEASRFGVAVDALRATNARTAGLSAVFEPLLELLPTVAVLAVLATAPGRIASGHLTVGDLIGMTYLLLTIAVPLNVISRFLSMLPLSVAGGARVGSVLGSTERPARGTRRPARGRPLAVELCGVRVARGGADLLDGVELTLAPGRVLAVVGAVGAGKTTLLEVVAGLLAPTSGRVLLGGVDVRDHRPASIPAAVALVSQTPFLFAESIRDNLGLSGERDEARLWWALRTAVVDDVVLALPDGLDTVVGERGATLSGGQRQRIALAAALLRRPGLLLLDDPTSALDAHVERQVLENLQRLARRRDTTIVIVASRPGAIALADRVLLLGAGRVRSHGTHRDLLRDPEYRRIVTAYAQDGGEPGDRAAS